VGGRGVRVRRLGGTRAGEMRLTRFLRNEAVTIQEMVETARTRTAQRCLGRPVLVIQDTTCVRAAKGGGGGLHLHAGLAVEAETGAVLGLVEAQFLERTEGRRGERKGRAFHDKESRRWLEGAEAAAGVCAGAACATMVADGEGDIFEVVALRPPRLELLVRVAQDRALCDGSLLFARLEALPVAGQMEIALPAAPGRPARRACLELRFGCFAVARPQSRSRLSTAGLADGVEVTVVEAREIAPPAGQEAAHWRLLSTHRVADCADARRLIRWYAARWTIEQLWRTLKTQGFDIEGLQMGPDGARAKLVTAAAIAAVSVLQLVRAREGDPPGVALADVFDPDDGPALEAASAQLEGKTARQKNPHPKGSLAYAAWVCARLGGWTGYYGKPGPVVMLHGWLQFQAIKQGWALALSPQPLGPDDV
jgi:hypothetical protein